MHSEVSIHDEVRVLFLVSALVLFVAQWTGADLPFSATESIVAAVLLVVSASITNPAQGWTRWLNEFIAMSGVLLFGAMAVNHYRAGLSFFDSSFASTEALALLSLLSLYFATRSIRDAQQRASLS